MMNRPGSALRVAPALLCALACAPLAGCKVSKLSISLLPGSAAVTVGGTQQFSARVSGAPGGVVWSVEPATLGTIDANGLFTAATTPATGLVRATSSADHVTSATAPVTLEPLILSFRPAAATIELGTSTTLQIVAGAGTTLTLDQGIGDVTGKSSVTVSPTVTTAYTLTAAANGLTAFVIATVKVHQPGAPLIGAFTATPSTITVGQSATLAWTETGGGTLIIDGGVGDVTGKSSVVVTPTGTTTYTLTATNVMGSDSATVTLTVTPVQPAPAAVTAFTAQPAWIVAGQATTLSWTVTGNPAPTLSIDQGVGAVTGSSLQLSPARSTTYLLTAHNSGGSSTLPVTVTVAPASPAPLIHDFSVEVPGLDASDATAVGRFHSTSVRRGTSAVLRWAVAGVAQVSIDNGVGLVAANGSATLTPQTSTTYTLTAAQGLTAQVTVAVDAATPLTPGSTGGADVAVDVDTGRAVHPISPLVYGASAQSGQVVPIGATLLRRADGRFTTYDWETNASNSGAPSYQSDLSLAPAGTQGSPGGAVSAFVAAARQAGLGSLVTVPLQGWVAADASGTVDPAQPPRKRFLPSAPRKGSPLLSTPDTTDPVVYQDEFVHWLDQAFAGGQGSGASTLLYALDQAPESWATTHPEVQQAPLAYADLIGRSIAMASSLKDAVAGARVMAPGTASWAGLTTLRAAPDQASPDWGGRSFLDAFLDNLRRASEAQGRRLLDLVDVQFFPEVLVGNVRLTDASNAAPVVAARVQEPRTLWDKQFVEQSAITQSLGNKGVDLIPRLVASVNAQYPGTPLCLSQYAGGGQGHISGALAQADLLGILGRTGVFAAAVAAPVDPYLAGAFALYRRYDGTHAFGDTSVFSHSSDQSKVSAHASVNSGDATNVWVVLINRDTQAHTASLSLTHGLTMTRWNGWQLAEPITRSSDGLTAVPQALNASPQFFGPALNALVLTLPAQSATLVQVMQ